MVLICCARFVSAQRISYGYDASGNQILRTLTVEVFLYSPQTMKLISSTSKTQIASTQSSGRYIFTYDSNHDPVMQTPDNTRNFNRYAYCLNIPLRYKDPTGMKWISVKRGLITFYFIGHQ